MGTLLPLSGNLTTSDINLDVKCEPKSLKYRTKEYDVNPDNLTQKWLSVKELKKLYPGLNRQDKLSDEFFQFDIIKLNQNN